MLFLELWGQWEEWSGKVEMNGKIVGTPGLLVQGIPNRWELSEHQEQGEEMRLVR